MYRDMSLTPGQMANSRRPEVLTSRSTSFNLLLVHLPTLPRSPLLRDRPVGQVDVVLLEIIKWPYTEATHKPVSFAVLMLVNSHSSQ